MAQRSMRKAFASWLRMLLANVITPESSEYETARLIFNRAYDIVLACAPCK